MVAGTSSDKLPPGWKEYVKLKNGKKIKYYSRAATGQKFYSRLAVMRYMNMPIDGANTTRPQNEMNCNQPPQTPLNHEKQASVRQAVVDLPDTNRSPVWLPTGWITEVKPKTGSRAAYKIYVDPATGKKFYSQPQVAEYLKSLAQKQVSVEENQDGAETNKSPAGLPPGWITEVKSRSSGSTYKIYINPATGSKFRSMPQVYRYLETLAQKEVPVKTKENTAVGISASETDVYVHQAPAKTKVCRSRNRKEKGSSSSNHSSDVIQSSSVDGLPVGWTKEIKIRHYANAMKRDPYYKDPVSGYVFRSKKDALRYLDTGDIGKCSIRPTKGDESNAVSHEDSSSNELSGHRKEKRSISKLVVNKVRKYSPEIDQLQNTAVDGLPFGWTREIQIRRDGHGKDSFYTDPVSGYMFRSKKDALRYIETGDISKCACKPKLRDANDIGSAKQGWGDDAFGQHMSWNYQSSIYNEEKNTINNISGEPAKADQLPNPAEIGLPKGWTKEVQNRKNGIGKDYFYTDPISGYIFRSKKDALRYIETGDVRKCANKPTKRDANDTGSTKEQVSGIQNSAVDGLPIGWTREIQTRRDGIGKDTFYTDPVGGYIFRSKKDALRYIETGDISKCAIKPKKRDAIDAGSVKQVISYGVSGQHISRKNQSTSVCKREQKKRSNNSGTTVEYDQPNNSAVDGLPIGWIREIQTRRDGIGKDSIYTDPVSGYMFRSKLDALRYIETGDISKCACKPKKRDANAAGSEHVGDPLTPVSRSNLPRSSSRQHYIGEKSNDGGKNRDASFSKPVKSESSSRKRGSSLPSTVQRKSRRVSQSFGHEFQEKRMLQSTPTRTSKRLAGGQPEMPNLQVSERDLRAAMKMSCEDEANILPMITMNAFHNKLPPPLCPEPTSVDGNPSHKQELPKKIMNSERSHKKILPSTPGRTSNTQAGSGYQSPSNLQLSEGSLGAETRKSFEDEAQIFPWININDVPDVVPQPFHSELSTTAVGMSAEGGPYPLDTETVPDVTDVVSMVLESISNMDMRQKFEEHSSQEINEKQDLENFKPQDVQGSFQFVDPLTNPFMNFSFHNPTDATPNKDNLANEGYSQQQRSNPFVQGNDNSGWLGSQNAGFQDGNPSSNSNSVRQEEQVNQLPSQFSLVAPGFGVPSFGVPSFGSTDSQQPASGYRNNSAFDRNI